MQTLAKDISKKGYKYGNLGWIPQDWKITTLKEISKVVRGSSPRPAGSPLYFNGNYLPWITVADITGSSNICLYETKSCLTEEGAKHTRILKPNTVLLANSGATLGVPKILKITAGANDGIAAFLGLKEVTDLYLYYWLQKRTRYLREQVAPGVGQPNLNTELIGSLKILLPTLTEQQKISEILSAWDTAIEKTKQLIEKQQRVVKGLMKVLLTGEKRLEGFHGDWETYKIGQLLKFGSGKDYKHLSKGTVPVYGTGGVMTYVDDYMYEGISVGIGRKGTIDKPILLKNKFWTVDTLFYTHSYKNCIPEYIYYLFLTINWKKYNEASGVPSLSKNTLEKIKIRIPPVQEQEELVVILNKMDEGIELLEQKLASLQKQKKGLMQKLLTGEVRVKTKWK